MNRDEREVDVRSLSTKELTSMIMRDLAERAEREIPRYIERFKKEWSLK